MKIWRNVYTVHVLDGFLKWRKEKLFFLKKVENRKIIINGKYTRLYILIDNSSTLLFIVICIRICIIIRHYLYSRLVVNRFKDVAIIAVQYIKNNVHWIPIRYLGNSDNQKRRFLSFVWRSINVGQRCVCFRSLYRHIMLRDFYILIWYTDITYLYCVPAAIVDKI